MKQKQVKTTPKNVKQTKTPKNAPFSKIVKEVNDEEEVIPKKVVGKKPVIKNVAKGKKIVVQPPPVEEDDLVEEEDEVDDDAQEENASDEEGDEDNVEEEVDDDDEEEDNQEEENQEDEEEEEEDDDDDDDEAPSEEAIGSEEPTIPSKVKSGAIPQTVPIKQIIHVSKLPKKCTQINIVEAFAKYGAIDQIHIVTTPVNTYANIAYKTEKAALKALADDKKVKVGDSVVTISKKREGTFKDDVNRERCVNVKNIKTGTTEEQLAKHFENCGEIESVKLVKKFKNKPAFAFIDFSDKKSVPAALKLHNSILNDANIRVTDKKEIREYDENLTVLLRNKQQFESIDVGKLENIFSKCGEIDYIDIMCNKFVLAFITFKTEDAALKALKLSGKTQQSLELELEAYSPFKKWTSIHVVNLPKDCTINDLKNHFSKAGEIDNIIIKSKHAIIRFEDSDGYCKSFLYNESYLKGSMIFIEPNSNRKKSVLSKSFNSNKGYKRKFQNGNSVFKAKKSKHE